MNISKSTLSETPVGRFVQIREILSEPDICHRLRELGFCENAIIRLVVNGEGNLICEVCNTRVGLNQSIAQDIIVTSFE